MIARVAYNATLLGASIALVCGGCALVGLGCLVARVRERRH